MVKFNRLLPVAAVASAAFLAPGVAKAELGKKDQAFLEEIEAYAQQRGSTISDVSAENHLDNARKICRAIQNAGVSTSFEKFVSGAKTEATTEDEMEMVGFFFGKSVEYYCPQYSDELKQYLDTL